MGFRGKNFLFEVKDENQPASKKALTPDEKIFFDTWRGKVFIIETLEEAIEILMRESL